MANEEFNKAAEAEARRAGRMKKAGSRIVAYADIDTVFGADTPEAQAIRDKMDSLMAAIDLNPTSFDTIIEYGTDPIKTLGKISKEILNVQTHLGEQVKVMDIAMSKVIGSAAEASLDQLLTGLKKAGVGVGKAGLAGASGLSKGIGKVWGSLSGAKKKRTEDEQQIYEMIEKLPEMYFEMMAMTKDLKNSETGIQAVMKEAEKLGAARVEMVRELNLYLGAAPEVLRRYDEVYIKEARDDFETSGGDEAEGYLKSVVRGKENFEDQHRILEASRAQGVDAAQSLRMLLEEMEKQRKIIQQFRTIRENEWVALMSGAGLQASALKIAQMIKKADDTGDRLHGMTMEMMQRAHEMTLNSQGRGTVDTAKLIESLQLRKAMIEKENEVRQQRSLEAEATRQQLRAATEKLIDAVEKSLTSRILDAAPAKEAPTAIPPADNDNSPPAVDAAPPSPRPRKTGTNPKGP